MLDYPVQIVGATELARDADGLATAAVTSASTVRGSDPNQQMILVTGDGVTLRGLSLDGLGAANTIAVAVDKARDFTLDGLHVSAVSQAIVVSASEGNVSDNFLGPPLSSGIVVGGGDVEQPSHVRIARNRLVDYSAGGIALITADPLGGTELFQTLSARIVDNVLSTTHPISGPSSPFGLRVNPIHTTFGSGDVGIITAQVTGNRVSGNHRYPLIVNAGQIERNEHLYAASVEVAFRDNQWMAGEDTTSRILLSFTNSRVAVAPFWNELATWWQYLQASSYALRHHGELESCLLGDPASTDCRVDHPEIEPCDGRVLGNVLEIRGPDRHILPYGTFIPDVCPG